jgi:outer membrane protein assembly factor BamE (lipoprotein component of BamABCDE complex)
MNKILYIFLILITVTNCTPKKVVKHHGVPLLEKKQNSLVLNETNKNDVIKILGNPSTKSLFDENMWIYIERKQTQSELINLGRMEVYKNDVLVLEFNNFGILKEKKLYDINNMENIKIAKETTLTVNKNKSFLYDFMSSMRQKMNDPLGQRAKKRRETNQR